MADIPFSALDFDKALLRELAAARVGEGLIDFNAVVDRDLAVLRDRGFHLRMIREIQTSREWEAAGDLGQAARLHWSAYSAVFFPLSPDPEFGFASSFADIAVGKLIAAADRGRMRDFQDLARLDHAGVPPWVLALAAPGKGGATPPVRLLESCLRLMRQAGRDDDDPEYAGGGPSPDQRAHLRERLREGINAFLSGQVEGWTGFLPVDPATGRLPRHLTLGRLPDCQRRAPVKSAPWPTTPAIGSAMLSRFFGLIPPPCGPASAPEGPWNTEPSSMLPPSPAQTRNEIAPNLGTPIPSNRTML